MSWKRFPSLTSNTASVRTIDFFNSRPAERIRTSTKRKSVDCSTKMFLSFRKKPFHTGTMDGTFILRAAVYFSVISLMQSICPVPPNMSCTVKVHTSSASFAGTDSNIYITLNGAGGESTGEQLLSGSFERGDLDTTQFTAKFIKALDNIVISHDGGGSNPSWGIDWARVVCHDAGIDTVIDAYRWMEGFSLDFDARVEKSCPDIQTPSNGTKVNCTNDNFAGSICTYSCDDNYVVQGPECITCLFDSQQWSEPENSTRCAEEKPGKESSLIGSVTGAVIGLAVVILLTVLVCKVYRLRRRKDSTDTTRSDPFARLEHIYCRIQSNASADDHGTGKERGSPNQSTLDLEPESIYEQIATT